MKIVIATGGTGGHIIPALKTAEMLRSKGHEILIMGSFGSWSERIVQTGFPVKELQAKGLTFASFRQIYGSVVAMIKAIRHALTALKKFNPDAVAGFGGYGAFPVVAAAVMSRYPTLIHEQNAVPGRANRLLARFVDRVAVSFPMSRKHFRADKTVWTGCPANIESPSMDRKMILEKFNLEENRTTILVLGGSQGSHRINVVVLEMMKKLCHERPVQIIHISGAADFEQMKSEYAKLPLPIRVFDFCDEMPLVLQVADVAIARAGALTVTETALAGIPTIFIPYPYAGGHQKENALALIDAGAAKMIEEHDLDAEVLRQRLLKTIETDRSQLRLRLEAVVVPGAAQRLSQEIMGLRR